jgi:hypothetical protein
VRPHTCTCAPTQSIAAIPGKVHDLPRVGPGASLAHRSGMPLSLCHVLRSCRGFSATEVTTILTALSVLSGMAAPAVSDYVEDAKLIRARSDVRTLSVSLIRLFSDVGTERARRSAWAEHDLLVGAGEVPQTAGASATEPAISRSILAREPGGAVPICRIPWPPIRGAIVTRSTSARFAVIVSTPSS